MNKTNDFVITFIRTSIILSFLLLWEFAVQSGRLPGFYTSRPTEILKDLIDFTTSGELAKHASITLKEAFSGLLIGGLTGIGIGVLLGQFPLLCGVFKPVISALHGIPQLTLAPVYILWFGLGLTSKIFLSSLMVFFNVFFATVDAIQEMDQKLVESANLLGASKWNTLWHVVLPACTPWIITGLRLGLGSSMVGAIVGEYMGSSAGFGWMVAYATSYFDIKRVMSCIVILLIVGLVLNKLLDIVENKLLKWRPETNLNIGASII